eukprot:4828544-Prymnesium_polylepis.1
MLARSHTDPPPATCLLRLKPHNCAIAMPPAPPHRRSPAPLWRSHATRQAATRPAPQQQRPKRPPSAAHHLLTTGPRRRGGGRRPRRACGSRSRRGGAAVPRAGQRRT